MVQRSYFLRTALTSRRRSDWRKDPYTPPCGQARRSPGFHDRVESIGPGGADLAAFLPDAQGIWIVNPFQLSWQEPGALGKNVFGADRCRWVPLGAVRCLNREIVAAAIGTDRHHRDWRSGTDRHLRVQ